MRFMFGDYVLDPERRELTRGSCWPRRIAPLWSAAVCLYLDSSTIVPGPVES